jgi:hypothetical protein
MNLGPEMQRFMELINEEGFRKTVPVEMNTPNATGVAASNAAGGFEWVFDGSGDVIDFNFMVPLDYDGNNYDADRSRPGDHLKLVLLASTTDAANTLDVDNASRNRAGEAETALTAPSVPAFSGTAVAKIEIDFQDVVADDPWQPFDVLGVSLGTTNSSGSCTVHGAWWEYRSCLVPYLYADRETG